MEPRHYNSQQEVHFVAELLDVFRSSTLAPLSSFSCLCMTHLSMRPCLFCSLPGHPVGGNIRAKTPEHFRRLQKSPLVSPGIDMGGVPPHFSGIRMGGERPYAPGIQDFSGPKTDHKSGPLAWAEYVG